MRFSYGISLPDIPKKPEDLVSWATTFYAALHQTFVTIFKRFNEMIIEGADASKPAAKGSKRFYFATDTSKLYYDGGTWVALN